MPQGGPAWAGHREKQLCRKIDSYCLRNVSDLLRYTQHFIRRCESGKYLRPAVIPQGSHPGSECRILQHIRIRIRDDKIAHGCVHVQQLENPYTTLETSMCATIATAAALNFDKISAPN